MATPDKKDETEIPEIPDSKDIPVTEEAKEAKEANDEEESKKTEDPKEANDEEKSTEDAKEEESKEDPKEEESKEDPKEEEEEIKDINCSDLLKNKVIILNVTSTGQIVANLYDLSTSDPPAPKPADTPKEPVDSLPVPENIGDGVVILETTIPQNTIPGESFIADFNGIKISVKTPPDSKPGDKIDFNLPPELLKGATQTEPAETEKKPQFDPNEELQKILKTIMNDEKDPQWIPRVFKFVVKPVNKKYNIVLEEQSILELIAGFPSGKNIPRVLSTMGCSGLDATNHTDVLAFLFGFPVVHLDKERDQLIGDIIKLINPIQSIKPQYKELKFLQGHSRKTLEHIKMVANTLLESSMAENNDTFVFSIEKLNKALSGKSKTKSSKSTGGKRTRRN